ncbi:MAG TPA: sulfurtransferase [Candidatus Dormibacteraeota bacterium]|nr:sulfurtransferase [Candidatus Dormibacteraeota bacterium]
MSFGPLVSAGWLREHIGDRDVTVIDFRWYLIAGRAQGALPDSNGRDAYLGGHIPGAVFVDLDAVTGTRGGGRHPLPAAWQVQDEMQKAGVDDATKVVVYDDAGGSVAARLWFLLGWFGHSARAVLDGGLQAWGEPLESRVPSVVRGTFRSRPPDRTRILDFEAVQQLVDVPLIDARVGERYRGEKEPVDPKAGHIPGALSAPWTENLGVDGRFKSAGELRDRYTDLGTEGGAVVYCGSGVNACHDLLAMELAGVPNGRLYAGSWSDWSNRDAPVATGKEPR